MLELFCQMKEFSLCAPFLSLLTFLIEQNGIKRTKKKWTRVKGNKLKPN